MYTFYTIIWHLLWIGLLGFAAKTGWEIVRVDSWLALCIHLATLIIAFLVTLWVTNALEDERDNL